MKMPARGCENAGWDGPNRVLSCEPMPIHLLREMTWTEVAALDTDRAVALLPVGAIEAHGPHLSLDTDGVIASEMARAAAQALAAEDLEVLQMPALDYSAARFAEGFPGTISIDPEVLTAMIVGIADNLSRWRIRVLGLANAHLDPTHLSSLHAAVDTIRSHSAIRIAFPDLTRRPWGGRLTEEFKSGACHAGQFESSIVLAASPDRVREHERLELEPNPKSLSEAIGAGQTSFEEAGGSEAYFGDPAAASAQEGHETIQTLGQILAETVRHEMDDR